MNDEPERRNPEIKGEQFNIKRVGLTDIEKEKQIKKVVQREIDSTLPISEIFYSIQGEGPSVGRPAIFIRLFGCNLRCKWCDTPYSYQPTQQTNMKIVTIIEEVKRLANLRPLVVITGGEPLIHKKPLVTLVRALKKQGYRYIEIETNGTIIPPPELNVMNYIVSPKLSNAGLKKPAKVQYDYFVALAKNDWAKFKFVIDTQDDMREVWEIEGKYHMQPEWTYLMPQARSTQEILDHEFVTDICKQIGYKYSPRIQIILWGNKRGV